MHHSLYYFDVLPLHPPPRTLESLTSYLMRIAEANHLHTFAALSAITDFARIRYATDVRAHSRLVLSNIAGRTGCQYQQIMATTLGHLERKFGRSERPGLLAGFFRNCLSTCLRYCPACIAQKAYYSLSWRFLALPGCSEHLCQFLNACGYCGATIPLFILPSRLGFCPACGSDLGLCGAPVLPQQDIHVVRRLSSDLEFLLSAQTCEGDPQLPKKIGHTFMRLRQKKQLSARQAGEISAIPGHEIFALEEGNDQRYVSLQSYLNYARYLGVTLKEICEAAADVDISREQLPQQPQHLAYEIVVVEHLQEAITAFGEEVTRDDMAAYTGRPIEYLRQFSAARAILDRQAHDRLARIAFQREQREDDLVKKVQEAIAILNERGEMPTRVAIGHIVGLSWQRLCLRYPRVKALLMQYPHAQTIDRKSRKREEDVLLTRVFVLMRAYKNVGLPASQETISRSLRIPLRQLRSYSRVKALLEQGL